MFTYASFQYDTNGFIYARVRTFKAPRCDNQLLFYDDTAPDLLGLLYKADEKKAYTLVRNEVGEPTLDGDGKYIVNEGVAGIDVSNAITGES